MTAATPQERVVDEARELLRKLDDGRAYYVENGHRDMVNRIDFTVGATLSLRTAVQEYDKAVGRWGGRMTDSMHSEATFAEPDAFMGWFAWCEYGCHWALRVFWWHGGDTACKRCRKRNGSWRYIKAVLDAA